MDIDQILIIGSPGSGLRAHVRERQKDEWKWVDVDTLPPEQVELVYEFWNSFASTTSMGSDDPPVQKNEEPNA